MDRPRRLAYAHTFGDRFTGRFARASRRVITRLNEFDPPRGVGSLTAATIILASVTYGSIAGGHIGDIAAEFQRTCDALANRSGFRIEQVSLSGEKELSRNTILALAGIDENSSLLCLDASATRRTLAGNPWITEAAVSKLYPGRLQIDIKERAPIALWQKDGRMHVIASDGTVLEEFTGLRYSNLPLVVGEGARLKARDFLTMLARYPVIRTEVEASVLVAQRRWNMRLKGGVDIKLPNEHVEEALQTLVALDRSKKLLSRDILMVDLRQPDRVTVRLSDEAAAVRTEAMKPKKPVKKAGAA
jgi:cell division protein FtsQ